MSAITNQPWLLEIHYFIPAVSHADAAAQLRAIADHIEKCGQPHGSVDMVLGQYSGSDFHRTRREWRMLLTSELHPNQTFYGDDLD